MYTPDEYPAASPWPKLSIPNCGYPGTKKRKPASVEAISGFSFPNSVRACSLFLRSGECGRPLLDFENWEPGSGNLGQFQPHQHSIFNWISVVARPAANFAESGPRVQTCSHSVRLPYFEDSR